MKKIETYIDICNTYPLTSGIILSESYHINRPWDTNKIIRIKKKKKSFHLSYYHFHFFLCTHTHVHLVHTSFYIPYIHTYFIHLSSHTFFTSHIFFFHLISTWIRASGKVQQRLIYIGSDLLISR